MSRRLLGYVVKLPDGTRSPRTPKPTTVVVATAYADVARGCYLVPVFVVRKPKPASPAGNTGGPPPIFVAWTENLRPNTNPLDRIGLIVERTEYTAGLSLHHEVEESGPEVGKPALVNVIHPVTRYVPAPVVAADGLDEHMVVEPGKPGDTLYRVMPDGAHEAAIAAAREEGRREGASRALATCRAQLEHWLGLWRHRAQAPEYPGDEVASGAKTEAYEQAILTIDEAAKGAAR